MHLSRKACADLRCTGIREQVRTLHSIVCALLTRSSILAAAGHTAGRWESRGIALGGTTHYSPVLFEYSNRGQP